MAFPFLWRWFSPTRPTLTQQRFLSRDLTFIRGDTFEIKKERKKDRKKPVTVKPAFTNNFTSYWKKDNVIQSQTGCKVYIAITSSCSEIVAHNRVYYTNYTKPHLAEQIVPQPCIHCELQTNSALDAVILGPRWCPWLQSWVVMVVII